MNVARVRVFLAANVGRLAAGFEFEKQMYMTKDEIVKRVEWLTTSSVELSPQVQVYNDGFKDGANFVLQNLQQTDCYTMLPLSEQFNVWIKETKRNGGVLIGSSIGEFFKWVEDRNIRVFSGNIV